MSSSDRLLRQYFIYLETFHWNVIYVNELSRERPDCDLLTLYFIMCSWAGLPLSLRPLTIIYRHLLASMQCRLKGVKCIAVTVDGRLFNHQIYTAGGERRAGEMKEWVSGRIWPYVMFFVMIDCMFDLQLEVNTCSLSWINLKLQSTDYSPTFRQKFHFIRLSL